jgi:PAS domain S-box-containing protein
MLLQFSFRAMSYRGASRQALRALLLLSCSCGITVGVGAQVKPIRRVLILYEIGLSSPSVSVLDQQIRTALENSPFQIELYREYLETTLFAGQREQREIRDWYVHKYRDRKPDIVITLGISPLRFVVDSHQMSFKDVPIVFGGLSGVPLEGMKLDSTFTGVWDRVEPAETLEAALRLKPWTKHVVVIGGVDSFDLEVEAWFHQSLRGYESKLDFTYLTDLPMPGLLERLSHLPPDTVILLTHIGLDSAGTRFIGASQADPMVVKAANAPVFGPSDVDLGHGEVGGYLDSFAMQGKIMGEMAVRILHGERPQNIPIVKGADIYTFDWRALKRWGMDERNLPSGSLLLNRPPSAWEQYKDYVIATLIVFLAQAAAIVALLWQRARRRKTEADLRKSEEKFSKAFRQSPLAFALTSLVDYRFVEVNDTFERYTGWKQEEVVGRTPQDLKIWVNTNQRLTLIEQLRAQGAVRRSEIPFRKKDGEVWTGLVSSELIDLDGQPHALSLIADITEVKLADEARREMEQALRASEERLRLAVQAGRMFAYSWDADTDVIERSGEAVDILGIDQEQVSTGAAISAMVHPEDKGRLESALAKLTVDEPNLQITYRIVRPDGTVAWLERNSRAEFDEKGKIKRIVGMIVDVTQRKMAEKALADLSGRLIEAQEAERTRIARELHDDINQRLAMIAVNLKQYVLASDHEATHYIQEACTRISDLENDIQALSHRLHSSKLEYLGLEAAASGFCAELSERQNFSIGFRCDGIPETIPSEISLCLFRVLQEAVHNAVKYSGMTEFDVSLTCPLNEIHLRVHDSGVGFDLTSACSGHGLGLNSMNERLRLVNGTLSIDSKLGEGTTILARVPLKPTSPGETVSHPMAFSG